MGQYADSSDSSIISAFDASLAGCHLRMHQQRHTITDSLQPCPKGATLPRFGAPKRTKSFPRRSETIQETGTTLHPGSLCSGLGFLSSVILQAQEDSTFCPGGKYCDSVGLLHRVWKDRAPAPRGFQYALSFQGKGERSVLTKAHWPKFSAHDQTQFHKYYQR